MGETAETMTMETATILSSNMVNPKARQLLLLLLLLLPPLVALKLTHTHLVRSICSRPPTRNLLTSIPDGGYQGYLAMWYMMQQAQQQQQGGAPPSGDQPKPPGTS